MLRKLKPTGERYSINDGVAVGLSARISSLGKASFILKAKDSANRNKTITLGSYPEMTLREAREAARKSRLDLKAGVDVNADKRRVRHDVSQPSSVVTLNELVQEFEKQFAPLKKTWQPRGPRTTRSSARQVIERVYLKLLNRNVAEITDEEFAQAQLVYKRVKQTPDKTTANGQASQARAYLSPVLDWASGRKRFAKIGASRFPKIITANLATTHDPATDDPTITGKRNRLLTEAELKSILPLLTYPAPQIGRLTLKSDRDFRPIAMRFLLFTAARLVEVCSMRWCDVDRVNLVWHKPEVKSTRGGPRSQDLPLSDAAMAILRQLPGWLDAKSDELVFPNETGKGKLGNWNRFQTELNQATKTDGWHRHDLRRTAGTIMLSLKVPPSTIEKILAHTDPFKGENIGRSASHYLQLVRVMNNTRDPQEEALATLASALDMIEKS